MITSKFQAQVNLSLFEKRRSYFNALFSMMLAVLMLAGVWGTTAVFAAAPLISDQTLPAVDENSATGTGVGTVVATNAVTFIIVGGSDVFAINPSTGAITVLDGSQIDYESVLPDHQFELLIRATNGDGSSEATVTIPINNRNDAPVVAASIPMTVTENSSNGTLVDVVPATDPDENSLTYSIFMWLNPASGPFEINPNTGEITVAGPLDFEAGPLSYVLMVKVSDGGLASTTIVTIDVEDGNDPPVANDDDGYTIAEDGVLTNATPSVLDNDTDQDGDSLEAAEYTQPANGTVVVNVDGTFTYTPTAQFNGIDTFTYFAYDGTENSALPATVTITVTGDNDAPTAVDDTYSVVEDNVLTVLAADGVLKNDTDPEHDSLTAVKQYDVDPSKGTLFLAFDGAFVFTPTLNYAGIVTFTYFASDYPANIPGLDSVAPATVTITVSNENDAPVVDDKTWSVDENEAIDFVVGTLDVTDPDDDMTFSFNVLSGNTNSAFYIDDVTHELRVATSNALDFETTPVFTLTVEVADTGNLTDTATVIVNLNDVNEAPTAVADPNYTTPEDITLEVTAPGVLGNDSDPDAGDTLTVQVDEDVINGTLDLAPDGSFIYTPTLNFSGVVTFTYHAEDGDGLLSKITTATITVQPVNDDPVAVDDPGYTTDEDMPLSVPLTGVLANDSDVDVDGLTAVNASNPANGSVTLNLNGSFLYTPDADFYGIDTFTYQAKDDGTPSRLSNTATVTITVAPDNDAPVINDQEFTIDENSVVGTAVGTAAATDVDDASLGFSLIPGGSGDGSFGISDSGDITVTNNAALDMEMTQSFTLTVMVSDAEPLTETAVITINLNNVNEFTPTLTANQVFTITETAASPDAVGQVAASDDDWEEDIATFAITGGTGASLFAIDNDGDITVASGATFDYETAPFYTLDIEVTDTGTNPNSRTATGSVRIDILDANEAPVIESLSVAPLSITEGNSVTLTGTFTDEDTADTHQVTVNWGDGSANTIVNDVASINVSHTYEDDPSSGLPDTYTIQVTVTDNGVGNLSDIESTSVTVTNVAPVLSNVAIATSGIDEGQSATLTGNIADAGSKDTFTLDVDWGDGSTVQSFSYPAGTTMFTQTHTFIDDGQPLTVNLALSDDDGGDDLDSVTITVNNVAPTVDAGPAQMVNVNDAVQFAGSFTDPGTGDTHTIAWDFDDAGTASGSLTPQHAYTTIGTYTAELTVTDDDDGSHSDTVEITVVSPSDMVATKTVRGSFKEEGTVFYTITMTNNGDSAQLDNAGNELTDVLPSELALVGAQVISGGGTASAVVATNTVTWNGSIASGSSVVIEIKATILLGTKGAVVSNQATIAYDADGNGSNEIDTLSDDPAVAGSYNPTVFNVADEYLVFLPIVLNNYTSAPDLVVTEIRATSNLIEVVIENQGNVPVVNSFWVDFYINPNPAPTVANEIWPELAQEGLAWGVTDSLAVGEVITLTFSTELGAPNLYFVADESLYYGSLPAGTPVYAQADSARAGVGFGAVAELDELTGKPYNNILGGTAVAPQ